MSFSKPEGEWIVEAVGGADAAVKEAARATAKTTFLAKQNTEVLKPESLDALRASMDILITKKGGKKIVGRALEGNPDKEFDSFRDLVGIDEIDDKTLSKLQAAFQQIVMRQKEMQSEMYGDPPEPVFTDKDIERELWSPLVRAEAIPDNFVPDAYSQEIQIFQGASDIYRQINEDYTQASSEHALAARRVAFVKDTISAAAGVISDSLKAAQAEQMFQSRSDRQSWRQYKDDWQEYKAQRNLLGENSPEFEAWTKGDGASIAEHYETFNSQSTAIEAAEGNVDLLNMSAAFVNGALTVTEKRLKNENAHSVADTILDSLESTMLAGLSGFSDPEKTHNDVDTQNFTDLFSACTSAILKGSNFLNHLSEAATAPTEGSRKTAAFAAISCLADATAAGIGANGGVSIDPETGENVDNRPEWNAMATYVRQAILGAADVYKVIEALGKGDKKGALTALGFSAISTAMTATIGQTTDAVLKDSADPTSNPFAQVEYTKLVDKVTSVGQGGLHAKMDQMVDTQTSMIESLLTRTGPPIKDEEQEKLNREKAKVLARRAIEVSEQEYKGDYDRDAVKAITEDPEFMSNVNEFVEAELAKLRETMEMTSPDKNQDISAKDALERIKGLTAQIDADNMKWQVMNSITKGGVSTVISFLPLVGLAGAIRDLVADCMLLVKRGMQLNEWLDNQRLTYGNHSRYGAAISARVRESRVQVSHHTVKVIFDTVGVAGEVARLADATAVTSAAITTTARLGNKFNDYAYRVHNENVVRKGWKEFKKARDNPADRKRVRKAMRWNTTLAKCVLAYGACKDGDPIAIEVVNRCGLTPEILQDDDDVCKAVVKYFQSVFNEDPEVMHLEAIPQDWHPAKLELTVECWVLFTGAAVERAVPKLDKKSASVPGVMNAMVRLRRLVPDGSLSKAMDGKGDDKDVRRDFAVEVMEAAQALIDSFDRYSPKAEDGAPHGDMADVISSLRAMTKVIHYDAEFSAQEAAGDSA